MNRPTNCTPIAIKHELPNRILPGRQVRVGNPLVKASKYWPTALAIVGISCRLREAMENQDLRATRISIGCDCQIGLKIRTGAARPLPSLAVHYHLAC